VFGYLQGRIMLAPLAAVNRRRLPAVFVATQR